MQQRIEQQSQSNCSYDFSELNNFFNKLIELSDPSTDVFLHVYLDICNQTGGMKDRDLKLKSLTDFISPFRHAYFNLYIFPDWGKGETEEVPPYIKEVVDNVVGMTESIMEKGLKAEIKSMHNQSLSLLRYNILYFLRSLTFMNREYQDEPSREAKKELFLEMYMRALFNQNQDYPECLSFHVALGIFLHIEVELFVRISKGSKINPKDIRTQASAPFIFIAFELARRDNNSKIQNLVLSMLKRACDIVTSGIYHPDDPIHTKNATKFPDTHSTEAQGLFDELFTEVIYRQNLPNLSYEELFEKIYEFSHELAYLPASYRSDLVNSIESHLAKSTGLNVKELRNTRKTGGEQADLYHYVPEQPYSRYLRETSVSHTELYNSQDKQAEYSVPDITYTSQYSYRESVEAKESAITLFKRELEQLPNNATQKKRVCEIIIRELESPEPNFDIKNIALLAEVNKRTVMRLFEDIAAKNPDFEF